MMEGQRKINCKKTQKEKEKTLRKVFMKQSSKKLQNGTVTKHEQKCVICWGKGRKVDFWYLPHRYLLLIPFHLDTNQW